MYGSVDIVYSRVTASGVVVSRPVYLDALVAANRHVIVTLLTALHDGRTTAGTWKFSVRSPVGGSVVVIFEHPVALDRGLYIGLALAGSQEATVGYIVR